MEELNITMDHNEDGTFTVSLTGSALAVYASVSEGVIAAIAGVVDEEEGE